MYECEGGTTLHTQLMTQTIANLETQAGIEQPEMAEIATEATDAGYLVYDVERSETGSILSQKFLGFAAVSDWDQMRTELKKRGHGAGAIYHKPEFDI